MCTKNGKAIGTWPFDTIRDFSCQDGNFSFTSGRRGPFGVQTHLYQLTPAVLMKLTTAVTAITGAQFRSRFSNTSTMFTSSLTLIQPGASSPGQNSINCFQSNSAETCNQSPKPLRSSCSLPELQSSLACHPHLSKMQTSSVRPIRQIKRACHQYEEIDLQSSVGIVDSASTAVIPQAAAPLSAMHVPTSPTQEVSTSQKTTVPCTTGLDCNPSVTVVEISKLSTCSYTGVQSPVYENIQNSHYVECKSEGQNRSISRSAHWIGKHHSESGTYEQKMQSKSDTLYDSPHLSSYSVPAACKNAQPQACCTQILPLNLGKGSITSTLYYNVQSSQQLHCSSKETHHDDAYEEIDSTAGHLRQQSSTQLQHSSPDKPHAMCRPPCKADASMIAQQLATEQGYELVTSKKHKDSHGGEDVMSGCCSLLDMGQGGPEQLYMNQKLHREMPAKDAEANCKEESDDAGNGCIVTKKEDTTRTVYHLPRRMHCLYQVPKSHSTPRCMCVKTLNAAPQSKPISVEHFI